MKKLILLMFIFSLADINAQTKYDLKKIETENQKSVDEATPDFLNFMWISKNGEAHLYSDIKKDHRIFGYEKPYANSKKLILFSVFTNEVEGNPFRCPFGSYYETAAMKNIQLKYLKTKGSFAEMELTKDGKSVLVYFLKKYIKFTKK